MKCTYPHTVEQWTVFEIQLNLDALFDNPFTEIQVEAVFQQGEVLTRVDGFYDGGTTWKVRYMPQTPGDHWFLIHTTGSEAHSESGAFTCIPAKQGNHGPVLVSKKTHFAYADGTPYFPLGTTAYAWTYRPEETKAQTLESFSTYGFNKIRMLFFPKYLAWLKEIQLTYEPPCLPFTGTKGTFDFKRFVVEYFQNFERCVGQLCERGIEADIILFHNYDFGMWGIDEGMDDEDALFYLRYIMARMGSFRNVWWSLANEYDLWITNDGVDAVSKIDRRDWNRIGSFIAGNDPYHHMISIHNYGPVYPDKPWMTHVSYQHANSYSLLLDLKQSYGKPVINDEYQYEGNLPYGWGNLSGYEGTLRHWLTFMAGGYGTHGECYLVDGNKRDIFWTYGGTLRGESPKRLAYLKQIAESLSFQDLEVDPLLCDGRTKYCLRNGYDEYIYLFLPGSVNRRAKLGPIDGQKFTYSVTVHDAWDCTVTKNLEATSLYLANDDPGLVVVTAHRHS